jgi:hypothetical protein
MNLLWLLLPKTQLERTVIKILLLVTGVIQTTTAHYTLDLTVSHSVVFSNYRLKKMWQGGFIFATFEDIWFVLRICWKCFSGKTEKVEELFLFKNLSRTFLELAAAFRLLSPSFLRWAPLGMCRITFDKAKLMIKRNNISGRFMSVFILPIHVTNWTCQISFLPFPSNDWRVAVKLQDRTKGHACRASTYKRR